MTTSYLYSTSVKGGKGITPDQAQTFFKKALNNTASVKVVEQFLILYGVHHDLDEQGKELRFKFKLFDKNGYLYKAETTLIPHSKEPLFIKRGEGYKPVAPQYDEAGNLADQIEDGSIIGFYTATRDGYKKVNGAHQPINSGGYKFGKPRKLDWDEYEYLLRQTRSITSSVTVQY
jgi:hypothetical protein